MEQIPRFYHNLMDYRKPNKVLVLFGPRQVGKTTLIRTISRTTAERIKYDTGNDYRIQEVWNSQNLSRLQEYVEGYDTVIIDKAQRVPGI